MTGISPANHQKFAKEEPLGDIWRVSEQITIPLFVQIESRALSLSKRLCFQLKPCGTYKIVLNRIEELVQKFVSQHREDVMDVDEDILAGDLTSARNKVIESFHEWQALVEDWKADAIRRIGVLTRELSEEREKLCKSEAIIAALKKSLEQKEDVLGDLQKRLADSNRRHLRATKRMRKLREEKKEDGKSEATLRRSKTHEFNGHGQVGVDNSTFDDIAPKPDFKSCLSLEAGRPKDQMMWCQTQSEVTTSQWGFGIYRRRTSDNSRFLLEQLTSDGSGRSPERAADSRSQERCSSGFSSATSSVTPRTREPAKGNRLQNKMETLFPKLARSLSRNNSHNGQVQPVSGIDSISSDDDSSISDKDTDEEAYSSVCSTTGTSTRTRRPRSDVEVQTMLSLDIDAAVEPHDLSTVSLECLRTLVKELQRLTACHITTNSDQVGLVASMLSEVESLMGAIHSWLMRICTEDGGASPRSGSFVEAQRLLIQFESMVARCAGLKTPRSNSTGEPGSTRIARPTTQSPNRAIEFGSEGDKLVFGSERSKLAYSSGSEQSAESLQAQAPNRSESKTSSAGSTAAPRRGLMAYLRGSLRSDSRRSSDSRESTSNKRRFPWLSPAGTPTMLSPAVDIDSESSPSFVRPTPTDRRRRLLASWISTDSGK